jgi:hypothetical protein
MLPQIKKNSLSLEYSILNVSKTYRLYPNPPDQEDSSDGINKLTIPINKLRMYYFFTKD